MLSIGVTGGIASGKSALGELWSRKGEPVCEADALAHEIVQIGQPAYKRIVAHFGMAVLKSDATLDRAWLARRVFAEPAELRFLEKLIHPEVRRHWQRWLTGQPQGTFAAVVVAPLIFETDTAAEWDVVVCVAAPEARRRRWLQARGLSDQEIRQRLAAQMPQKFKMEGADYVVYNSGDRSVLRRQAMRVWQHIERKHSVEAGKYEQKN